MPATPFSGLQRTGVPRHLVHKRAHTEVFLTGWHAQVDGTYTVTAQWPRSHGFYQPIDGHYDSLIFAETIRQTLPLLSHEVFDVPMGHQLIWGNMTFEVMHEALRVDHRPLDVTLIVECRTLARRRAGFMAASANVTAIADATTIGHARTSFSAHSPGIYQRLRAGRHDVAAARASTLAPALGALPASVGRQVAEDVVLSPASDPHTWQLRADLDHPFLFDHPVDHAPGMLLLEAARQATIAARPLGDAVVTGMTTRFHQYVELDRPAWVHLTPRTENTYVVHIDQDEHTCFEAETTART
jgi:2-oxo-3-(phosphooxy)propyl 3-oxoalkanoate synthase